MTYKELAKLINTENFPIFDYGSLSCCNALTWAISEDWIAYQVACERHVKYELNKLKIETDPEQVLMAMELLKIVKPVILYPVVRGFFKLGECGTYNNLDTRI